MKRERSDFLLLVATFAQTACPEPWKVVKRAQEVPFPIPGYRPIEDLAIEFVAWQCGEGPEGAWMIRPRTPVVQDQEEGCCGYCYNHGHCTEKGNCLCHTRDGRMVC